MQWLDHYQGIADSIIVTAAVIGVFLGLTRWLIRRLESKIVGEIKKATYQIQPGANGGKSLSDLHQKVDLLADALGVVRDAVVQLEDDFEQLEYDVEELR